MDKILNKIWMIINIIIPIDRFKESFKPLVCRHKMLYFDMVWFVDDECYSDSNFNKFNGKVWKDTFCECQKCGVQKKKSMKVGEWSKWINCEFKLNQDLQVDVEILPYGGETKQQKRDRILNELGI